MRGRIIIVLRAGCCLLLMSVRKSDIIGRRDREYIATRLQMLERAKYLERLTDGISLGGLEHFDDIKDEQFIVCSNHRSQLDPICLSYLFLKHLGPEQFPRFVAGKNLDSKFLGLFGLDFRRAGAFFVDRELIAESREEAIPYLQFVDVLLKKCLRRGQNFAVFPEGGRVYFGEPMQDVKNGFARAILGSGANPLVVPMAIDYDKVVEQRYFKILKWSKTRFRRLYYATDLTAFGLRYIFPGEKGRVYVNVGKPSRLSEIIGDKSAVPPRKAFGEFVQREVLELYKDIQKRKKI